MQKKILSTFHFLRWLMIIFIISLSGLVGVPFKQETSASRILKGTIINKNEGLVTVGSSEHPGHIVTLSTDPGIERLALRTGDHIIVEFGPDYIIQAILKQG